MRDAARDWAQQAAAPREARRGRDDRRETFGRNVGGTAEPSTPLHRRGAQGGGAAPAVAMPNGRHLRTELPGQTWDGNRLDLGTPILDAGWSDHSPVSGPSTRWTMPAGGSYWDYDVELEIGGTAAESGQAVDITLKVDGQTRRVWTDVWVTDNLHLEYRIGTLDRGSAVTLEHTGGAALTVLGGQSVMQLVDSQVGEVFEAPECPEPPAPWAWYRGDDLTGYADGELVPSWPDRAGGAGTVEMIREWEAGAFASDLFGGQPGIHDPEDNGPYYHVDLDRSFPDGVTFGLVIDGPGDIAVLVRTEPFHDSGEAVLYTEVLSESDPGEWSLTLRSTDTNANTEWASNFEPSSWDGPTLILVSFSDNRMTAWRNDGELIVDRADISTAVARAFDKLIFWGYVRRDDDPQIAEVLVWDHALDAAERSQAWDYVECRYGLESESMPEPWAWYRGDDLDGYAEGAHSSVIWVDRKAGIGDITFDGFNPTVAHDVLGGSPGLTSVTNTIPITPRKFPNGLAIAIVAVDNADGRVDIELGAASGADGYARSDVEFDATRTPSIEGYFPDAGNYRTIDGSPSGTPVIQVGSFGPAGLAMWRNGELVGETADSFDFSSFPDYTRVADFGADSAFIVEVMIFDHALDEGQQELVWAYAQARYGL